MVDASLWVDEPCNAFAITVTGLWRTDKNGRLVSHMYAMFFLFYLASIEANRENLACRNEKWKEMQGFIPGSFLTIYRYFEIWTNKDSNGMLLRYKEKG